MIIACPKCNTGFFVTPEQIGLSGRRVKCSKCSHIWHAKIYQKLFKSEVKVNQDPTTKIDYLDYKYKFESEKKKQEIKDTNNNNSKRSGFDFSKFEKSKPEDKSLNSNNSISKTPFKNIFDKIGIKTKTKTNDVEENFVSKNIVDNHDEENRVFSEEDSNVEISTSKENIYTKEDLSDHIHDKNIENKEFSENADFNDILSEDKFKEFLQENLSQNSPDSNAESIYEEMAEEFLYEKGKPIINLPAIIPVKIPFYLAIIPVIFLTLIFTTIWTYYSSILTQIGLKEDVSVEAGLKITDVSFFKDESSNKLLINYSISNESASSVKPPLAVIRLRDSKGFELSKIIEKIDFEVIESGQKLNFNNEFDAISDEEIKISINLQNNDQ